MCSFCRRHTQAQQMRQIGVYGGRAQFFLSHGTNLSAGVAVLFKPLVNAKVLSSTEVVRSRLLIVKAGFCFVNVYAPNPGPERVCFFTLLEKELVNYHQDQLITGGDFNCTLEFTIDRISDEPHPQSTHSQTLNSVITHLDLLDAWRVKHPQSRQYTWVRIANGRVSAASLDRLYISQNLGSRLIYSNINPVGFTKHHLVSKGLVNTQR